MKSGLFNNIGTLIPIAENTGKRAVNARDLHGFLESKQDFSTWIKARIDKYDFVENQDYQVFHNFMENSKGGRPLIEYALSIDMAKELSMVEGNEKGKEARRYFIACEKRLNSLSVPSYQISDPIKRAEAWIEEEKKRQQLALENGMLKPKAEYFDHLVERKLLTNIRDTAKQIGLSQKAFVYLLIENKFVYRDLKKKLKPYAEHTPLYFEMKDFEKNGHAGTQLLVTPKGKETFRLMWGK
ncbi:antA/AntB antirepressor family protein [Bacteroides cellulosilyticus]|uniref:antA/AntB antirepressor family protein n=1 Tax=Bacteroides cellulosilyticus TaxID=246787 RepID=UPI001C6FF9E2|nr:antA/AntB antirepressor family protein [Bacteroides cellulosilyticus]